MDTRKTIVLDGNEAAASVAYQTNEICVIYPITPASSMGELADAWSVEGKENIWGTVPNVVEMQSEGGASGAIHGALQTGSLATTFTSSQGLLLMIPNMYHISAELSPTVFHVASRAVASQGMTIYPEHSDVMAVRATGFAILCSLNVQEVQDMALITQATSLKARVPFLHFFDGFRTSHEVSKVEILSQEQMRKLIDNSWVHAHRLRKMSPENPTVRGVIQNSDIYFQGRESVNTFYDMAADAMEEIMYDFKNVTGREYHVMEYVGDLNADRIIILMGSGAETVRETVLYLNEQGEKVGLIIVRLFQPFSNKHFLQLLPSACKSIAVLDRTKEPGAGGEPLYQKVSTAMMEAFTQKVLPIGQLPKVVGGRFGIGGKEFTPAMVKAIFDEIASDIPKRNFTIGIDDDVTHTSLNYDHSFHIESDDVIRAIFYGLGSDGTVSAVKNTAKIIGEKTDYFVQGYFVYDARKTGSRTVSHLRLSPRKIYSTYLIQSAGFIGCHQSHFLEKINVLQNAAFGAVFLLNTPFSKDEIWDQLPQTIQKIIIDKKIQFFVIDAYKVAQDCGIGSRVSAVMLTCFFALSNILPREEAIKKIKESIQKTYAKKGIEVIQRNFESVDQSLVNLHRVEVPTAVTSHFDIEKSVPSEAPEFVQRVVGKMLVDQGDELQVSMLPNDGTFPVQTTCWERRNVSLSVPAWDPDKCIQCGRCSFVCPHSVIRVKQVSEAELQQAPTSFQTAKSRHNTNEDARFALQVFVEDCTGCGLCVETCPLKEKALKMVSKSETLKQNLQNIEFFKTLPYSERTEFNKTSVRGIQYLQPLFEFSTACAGCGETPYVKLLSQLFGDRAIIANACGCSSVFGSNMPTSPWTTTPEGYGPTWSSSLFEDNAEFGVGFCLTEDKYRQYACELLRALFSDLDENLVGALIQAKQTNDEEIKAQRRRVYTLKACLSTLKSDQAKELMTVADYLIKHSIWAIGGDGWAYDIGYGGIDHVITMGRDINLLVLDTEVYSNTGGQASKATPRGAVVKFAASGTQTAKKDLGLMAMTYGNVYVAQIALGADPSQAISAFLEAESFQGPSLIIAYCHCIAHGIDMRKGLAQQELAVKSGYWPLYRYNPDRIKQGLNPMQIDSQKPSVPFSEYVENENRYRILAEKNPAEFQRLIALAQQDIEKRWKQYEKLE
jgi:pyruvate-ferredoxin/flavodoxin oxidoreductase